MKLNLQFAFLSVFTLSLCLVESQNAVAQQEDFHFETIQHCADTAPEYALKIIESKLINHPTDSQKVWLSSLKAQAYISLSEDAKAETEYKHSIELAISIQDTIQILQNRNRLALLEFKKGNYSNCFELYLTNKKMAQHSSNCKFMSNSSLGVATMYYYLKNKEKCLEQFLECNKLAKQCKDTVTLQKSCHNLASLYIEFGEKEKSMTWMEEGLSYLKPDNYFGLAQSYSIYAAFHDYPQQKEKMKQLHDVAIEFAIQSKDSSMMAFCYLKKCSYYILSEQLDSATVLAKKALSLYRKVKLMDGILHANGYLSKIGLLEKDPQKAIKALKEYIEVSDTIYTELAFLKATELETKYETEKKEAENKLLKQTNLRKEAELENEKTSKQNQAILLVSLLLITFTGGVYIFYRRKLKTNERIATIEKQNFTAVIKAEENERGRIAKELHDGLGQLLSSAKLNVAATEESVSEDDLPLIKTSMQLIDEAVSEVRSVSHNLMPIALTTKGLIAALEDLVEKINQTKILEVALQLKFDENLLSKSTQVTLYRVIQEILNNALKHSKATTINVQIESRGKSLQLIISDNGIGFDSNEIKTSKGIGWTNIFSRISLLNGKINIDSKQNKGTHLSIQIPLA